jgi:lipid-A-disaccharide synthase
MKYYFIAGEASGDMHAANCIKELKKLDANATFAFTGGSLMQEVTASKPDIHISEMAFMGFMEVLKNLKNIRKNFNIVKESILRFKPDLLVLVDYPGFNLRMAKWAKKQGIKTDYYISPTVWAWKENRVEQIRAYINKLFVILPFEEAFYQKHNIKVYFTGHPLLDALEHKRPFIKTENQFRSENRLSDKPIVAVLPGSRVQEIEQMMQVMLNVMKDFPRHEFVVAGSNTVPAHIYTLLQKNNIPVVFNQTYELMTHAKAGIIKSGTSSLESALFDLPQVVCYRTGGISYAIGKRLVKVKYISLVNLILDKPVVKELIQHDFNEQNISSELNKLLTDELYTNGIKFEYQRLIKLLGGTGASHRLAQHLKHDAFNES